MYGIRNAWKNRYKKSDEGVVLMIKHNKKLNKAFDKFQKTGNSKDLTKELQKIALKDFDNNKVFVTAI